MFPPMVPLLILQPYKLRMGREARRGVLYADRLDKSPTGLCTPLFFVNKLGVHDGLVIVSACFCFSAYAAGGHTCVYLTQPVTFTEINSGSRSLGKAPS